MNRSRTILALSATLAAFTLSSVIAGDITGTVTYGAAPPKPAAVKITKDAAVCAKEPHLEDFLLVDAAKGIKNVVISVTGVKDGKKMMVSPTAPKVDQHGCRFMPRVQVIPAGQTVDIVNSDGILHNIHTWPKNNAPINKAQPKFRKVMQETFEKPDLVRITCDVHSWMTGWLIVAEHPYYAMSAANGSFSISGVPAGTYTVNYWHETLGEKTAQVTVPASGAVKADLTFPAK